LGAGDCRLSLEVVKHVKFVYALEVSREITKNVPSCNNLQVVYSDGSSVPVATNSIDVAYSYQLMEHLHPEDVYDQLREIYRVLTTGGKYICITPNRLMGPADISRYFDDVATGFHLREYTNGELRAMFLAAGFKGVASLRRVGSHYRRVSVFPSIIVEKVLKPIPRTWRRRIAGSRLLRQIIRISIVATK
jgi:SAM-dependent methyltransferase